MIETIYALGDDALNNSGRIVFDPLSIFPNMEALQFRITNFSIPEQTVGSYEVKYKTQKFTKPNGSFDSGNTFSFTFRADKYYSVYESLSTWKQLIANDISGAVSEDVNSVTGLSPIRTNFSVMTEDSNGNATSKGWRFTNAFLKTLGGIDFDQTSDGEPITVSVTLEYVKMIPGNDA